MRCLAFILPSMFVISSTMKKSNLLMDNYREFTDFRRHIKENCSEFLFQLTYYVTLKVWAYVLKELCAPILHDAQVYCLFKKSMFQVQRLFWHQKILF